MIGKLKEVEFIRPVSNLEMVSRNNYENNLINKNVLYNKFIPPTEFKSTNENKCFSYMYNDEIYEHDILKHIENKSVKESHNSDEDASKNKYSLESVDMTSTTKNCITALEEKSTVNSKLDSDKNYDEVKNCIEDIDSSNHNNVEMKGLKVDVNNVNINSLNNLKYPSPGFTPYKSSYTKIFNDSNDNYAEYKLSSTLKTGKNSTISKAENNNFQQVKSYSPSVLQSSISVMSAGSLKTFKQRFSSLRGSNKSFKNESLDKIDYSNNNLTGKIVIDDEYKYNNNKGNLSFPSKDKSLGKSRFHFLTSAIGKNLIKSQKRKRKLKLPPLPYVFLNQNTLSHLNEKIVDSNNQETASINKGIDFDYMVQAADSLKSENDLPSLNSMISSNMDFLHNLEDANKPKVDVVYDDMNSPKEESSISTHNIYNKHHTSEINSSTPQIIEFNFSNSKNECKNTVSSYLLEKLNKSKTAIISPINNVNSIDRELSKDPHMPLKVDRISETAHEGIVNIYSKNNGIIPFSPEENETALDPEKVIKMGNEMLYYGFNFNDMERIFKQYPLPQNIIPDDAKIRKITFNDISPKGNVYASRVQKGLTCTILPSNHNNEPDSNLKSKSTIHFVLPNKPIKPTVIGSYDLENPEFNQIDITNKIVTNHEIFTFSSMEKIDGTNFNDVKDKIPLERNINDLANDIPIINEGNEEEVLFVLPATKELENTPISLEPIEEIKETSIHKTEDVNCDTPVNKGKEPLVINADISTIKELNDVKNIENNEMIENSKSLQGVIRNNTLDIEIVDKKCMDDKIQSFADSIESDIVQNGTMEVKRYRETEEGITTEEEEEEEEEEADEYIKKSISTNIKSTEDIVNVEPAAFEKFIEEGTINVYEKEKVSDSVLKNSFNNFYGKSIIDNGRTILKLVERKLRNNTITKKSDLTVSDTDNNNDSKYCDIKSYIGLKDKTNVDDEVKIIDEESELENTRNNDKLISNGIPYNIFKNSVITLPVTPPVEEESFNNIVEEDLNIKKRPQIVEPLIYNIQNSKTILKLDLIKEETPLNTNVISDIEEIYRLISTTFFICDKLSINVQSISNEQAWSCNSILSIFTVTVAYYVYSLGPRTNDLSTKYESFKKYRFHVKQITNNFLHLSRRFLDQTVNMDFIHCPLKSHQTDLRLKKPCSTCIEKMTTIRGLVRNIVRVIQIFKTVLTSKNNYKEGLISILSLLLLEKRYRFTTNEIKKVSFQDASFSYFFPWTLFSSLFNTHQEQYNFKLNNNHMMLEELISEIVKLITDRKSGPNSSDSSNKDREAIMLRKINLLVGQFNYHLLTSSSSLYPENNESLYYFKWIKSRILDPISFSCIKMGLYHDANLVCKIYRERTNISSSVSILNRIKKNLKIIAKLGRKKNRNYIPSILTDEAQFIGGIIDAILLSFSFKNYDVEDSIEPNIFKQFKATYELSFGESLLTSGISVLDKMTELLKSESIELYNFASDSTKSLFSITSMASKTSIGLGIISLIREIMNNVEYAAYKLSKDNLPLLQSAYYSRQLISCADTLNGSSMLLSRILSMVHNSSTFIKKLNETKISNYATRIWVGYHYLKNRAFSTPSINVNDSFTILKMKSKQLPPTPIGSPTRNKSNLGRALLLLYNSLGINTDNYKLAEGIKEFDKSKHHDYYNASNYLHIVAYNFMIINIVENSINTSFHMKTSEPSITTSRRISIRNKSKDVIQETKIEMIKLRIITERFKPTVHMRIINEPNKTNYMLENDVGIVESFIHAKHNDSCEWFFNKLEEMGYKCKEQVENNKPEVPIPPPRKESLIVIGHKNMLDSKEVKAKFNEEKSLDKSYWIGYEITMPSIPIYLERKIIPRVKENQRRLSIKYKSSEYEKEDKVTISEHLLKIKIHILYNPEIDEKEILEVNVELMEEKVKPGRVPRRFDEFTNEMWKKVNKSIGKEINLNLEKCSKFNFNL